MSTATEKRSEAEQLANFRIDREEWRTFKGHAARDGSTASTVLKRFIASYNRRKAAAKGE